MKRFVKIKIDEKTFYNAPSEFWKRKESILKDLRMIGRQKFLPKNTKDF